MTVQGMHYDFKKKLNKVDSEKYKNLLIPEIDWALNEAQSIFIDLIAEPRLSPYLGFEVNQKSIDDIKTIVEPYNCTTVISNPSGNYGTITLPQDYLYYVDGYCTMYKEGCGERRSRKLKIRQHDDDFEDSPFYKSSFEWGVVNALFIGPGAIPKLKVFNDGTFSNREVCISYIRQPKYINYAQGFKTGQYKLPDGTLLTGKQDSELPEHTHREIVDIATMITSGELNMPSYKVHLNKLKLNKL